MSLTRSRAAQWTAALLVVVMPAALGACGDDDDATTTTTAATSIVGPVVVDVATLDGTTVDVTVGQVVDVDVGATDVAAWTATVADGAVVSFVPGRDDGSATFNPGFETLAAGTTAATLTGPDGSPVEFTIAVAAD